MADPHVRIAVIIGSCRPGRFADTVASWFLDQVRQRNDVELDVIDLASVDVPALYLPATNPAAEAYRRRIDAADAFVVVTPEYNHGYPAPLKQAIDVAYTEWFTKPVAFVSYGGVAGGLRAVEQLRQVFAELHAVTIRDTVSFHGPEGAFDAGGQPIDRNGAEAAAKILIDRLIWWAAALRAARERHPYAA